MDFAKLNDTPVHVAGFKQREIDRPGDSPLQQFELVVIVRDQKSHQSFLELLGDGNIRLDLPSDSGEGWRSYKTVILQSLHTTSTHGSATIYRHEITLREALAESEHVAEPVPPDPNNTATLELRLEALIEQLVSAGVINRTVLDAAFARLVSHRRH